MDLTLSVIGIVVAVLIVMLMCYKGISSLIAATIGAIVIALTSRINLVDALVTYYAAGVGNMVGSLLLTLLFASCFSIMMVKTKAAYSIADWLTRRLGMKYTPLIIMFASAILSAGGMMIGVYMTMFPIGIYLCSKSNYSKDIVLGAIIGGAWTFAYSSPFMPSLQNMLLQNYLGTSPSAGMVPGLVTGILMLVATCIYLQWQAAHWARKGRVFVDWEDLPDSKELSEDLPSVWCGLLPIVLILVLYNAVGLALPLSLACGTILLMLLQIKRFSPKEWLKVWESGMMTGVQPLINVAAMGGIGALIGQTVFFDAVVQFTQTTTMPPYVFAMLMSTFLAFCLGSASSGLSTALPTMAPLLQNMASASGADLGVMARIMAIGSVGPDSLPHNGTLVAAVNQFNTTYKKSYFPVFIVSVVYPLISVVIACAMGLLGIV